MQIDIALFIVICYYGIIWIGLELRYKYKIRSKK